MLTAFALWMCPAPLQPVIATQSVEGDPDDPAIWINSKDRSKSLIIGTDKTAVKGRLYLFDLSGKIVQVIQGLDRPNNVDVFSGSSLGGRSIDVAAVTERGKKRLRFFLIDKESGFLTDISGDTGVFRDRTDENAVPMGVTLLPSKKGIVHVIVSPKSGPSSGYLECSTLRFNNGKIDLEGARSLGQFSGQGEIESLSCDRATGKVFYSDEQFGIRWLSLGGKEEGTIGLKGYDGDREGTAHYLTGSKSGLILSSDQIKGGSKLHVFDRMEPHQELAVIPTVADDTDGLECTSMSLGSKFPKGILVMMNSKDQNFLVFDMRDVLKRLPRN